MEYCARRDKQKEKIGQVAKISFGNMEGAHIFFFPVEDVENHEKRKGAEQKVFGERKHGAEYTKASGQEGKLGSEEQGAAQKT